MTSDLVLSILMLAGVALLVGAYVMFRRQRDRRKALLMLVAALVMFGNVAIWMIPPPDGQSLMRETRK